MTRHGYRISAIDKMSENEIHDNILFEELTAYETLVNKNSLLDGFILSSQESSINFDDLFDL